MQKLKLFLILLPILAPPLAHSSVPVQKGKSISKGHTTISRGGSDRFNSSQNGRPPRHLFSSHRHEAECGFRCDDGTCIKSHMKCDGYVHCHDLSDEHNCQCIDRIGTRKTCDGYEDCPLGEDEIGCGFDCGEDEFSCSDGKGSSATTCIKISKRCDGRKDCPGQEDERGCFRLTNFDLAIRGILPQGALQKKIGNEWFTICKSSGRSEDRWLQKYARKTCENIVGEVDDDPKTTVMSVSSLNINSELLEAEPLLYAKFAESESLFPTLTKCTSGQIYKVECGDPPCGWPTSKYEAHTPHHQQHHTHNEEGSDHHRHRRRVSKQGLTAKIVGGYDSVHGAWPFIVGIYRNGTFHCGGSIVNKEYIITAAHCCHGYDKYVFEIQVGMTRRNSWSPYEQTRTVTEIHVHERYDSKVFSNDIALMKVDYPFYLSKWVTTACLATEKAQDPIADTKCKVIGWGDLSEDGAGPDHLQEVELSIMPKCQDTFTKDIYQICAGVMAGGQDACQGDSGGPLICSDSEGRPYVHGLVSFGRGCARPNQAGVYTRVSAYRSWIQSFVSGENSLIKLHKRPKECHPHARCLRDGGECLFEKFECDQDVHCLGMDDEVSCQYLGRAGGHEDDEPGEDAYEHIRSTSHDTQEHTHEYGSAKLCGPTEFQCKTTLSCIPLEVKCDGKYDCADNTDEKQCECGEIVLNAFPQFKCDGITHCLDGTDELDCENCNGTRGMFKCPFSDECISDAHVCDGTIHCTFGEDEIDCIRLTKTKGKDPEGGFLNDKLSRGLHSGYVVIRSSGTKWRKACVEDFGTNLKEIVCPYLRLGTPEDSELTRSGRKAPSSNPTLSFSPRRARDVENCHQVKVHCGEPSCGVRKLFSMSENVPTKGQIGIWPWLVLLLVEGHPVCTATLVRKQWLLVSSDCINLHVRSTVHEYLSAVAGFSKSTNIVASPMEQIKRVHYIGKMAGGMSLLRLESAFMTDHFANSICTDIPSDLDLATCTRVSVINETEVQSWAVSFDPDCEKDGKICIQGDGENCQGIEGSFVYCTIQEDSWFLLGYVEPIGSAWKCLDKVRMELINPFHGSETEETKKILNRPPSSIIKPPGCSGTRCTYGNCVGKSYVCDGIAHCPDYLDEKRCQRHYQVLRSQDDEEENVGFPQTRNGSADCSVGHFRCVTTENCVPISAFCDGISDCGDDDQTDEPLNEDDCSCRHYLELSAPERICDDKGVEHCPDRTDELHCPCRPDSFVCDTSSSPGSPVECIHRNLVCDSVQDCKNGRDEANCTALSKSLTNVLIEGHPEILEGYVLVRVKGTWHPYCTDQWSDDLGHKICKFLGYGNLDKIETIELEEREGKVRSEEVSVGSGVGYEGHVGGEELLWILAGGEELNAAGPIEQVVYGTDDLEEYHCNLGYISCS